MTTYPKSNFSYTFLESIRKLRSQTTLEIGPTLEICDPHEDSRVEETMTGILETESIGEWPNGRDSDGFYGTKVR